MQALDPISIEKKYIGEGHPTYIIAEIGFNHGGDMSLAVEMIKAASRTGADAVKFQSYKSEELVLDTSEHFELIKSGEIDLENHLMISKIAAENNITFFSTPYSFSMLDLLEKINTPAYKIASMDLTNLPLISHIAKTQKPIILSTGMGTMNEISDAIDVIRHNGNKKIILLHCISNYPTKIIDANIRSVTELKKAFEVHIGYSDHVCGNEAAIAAVALGASVIEKHFTVDKNLSGPDHSISSDENELSELILSIRSLESSLGSNIISNNRPDRINAKAYRRSIYARTNINRGAIIKKEMLTTVRPGDGIPPRFIDDFIGEEAIKDIDKSQKISWEMIGKKKPSFSSP